VREFVQHPRIVTGKFQRPPPFRDSLWKHAPLIIDALHHPMRVRKVRSHFHRGAGLPERVVAFVIVVQHLRRVGIDDCRKRIRLARAHHFGGGFVQPSQGRQVEGIPLVRPGIVGVQIDGALEFPFRPLGTSIRNAFP
jgi:hypothetical protein